MTKIDFQHGYNANFTPFVESTHGNITYVPWAIYNKYMQAKYPSAVFHYDIEVEKSDLKLDEFLALSAHYERAMELTTPDQKKKYQTKLDNLADQFTRKSTFASIKSWFIMDDVKSEIYYFPVMDNRNNSITTPDSRDISDNLMRCYSKSVARYTGFTLRLWTREFLDLSKKGDSQHPVYRGLSAYATLCLQKGLSYADCDFTTPIETIRAKYKDLVKSDTDSEN